MQHKRNIYPVKTYTVFLFFVFIYIAIFVVNVSVGMDTIYFEYNKMLAFILISI